MHSETASREPVQHAVRYASLSRRLRALAIDTAVVLGSVTVVAIVGDVSQALPGTGRAMWLAFFCILFLYEPVLVWYRGATIGHATCNLVVLVDGTGHTPSLGRAVVRYLVKGVLGLVAFFTMAMTRRHQAVHDILTRTTVQLATDASAEDADFHLEREEPELHLPSRLRRAMAIAAYLVLALLLVSVALTAFVPAECLDGSVCSSRSLLVLDASLLIWFGISLGSVIAGWRGILFGARAR